METQLRYGLPPSRYLDPSFLEVEKDRLFRAGWVCVGRVEQLPETGSYLTATVLSHPILAVRGAEGVQVFANVCRHRFAVVAEGCGRADRFTCPYHAWTYGIDGRLIGAPYMRGVAGFHPEDYGLTPIRSEIWGGFLFVNLSGDAAPLAPQLTTLDGLIERYDAAAMRVSILHDEVWPANWKSVIENFMEGYHLTPAHSETLSYQPTRLCEKLPNGPAFTAYRVKYHENFQSRPSDNPALTEEDRRWSVLYCVYPSLVAVISSALVAYICVQPDQPTTARAHWAIATRAPLAPDARAELERHFQIVNGEDKAILARVTAGLAAAPEAPGPLAPSDFEGCVWDIANHVLTATS